MDLVLVEAAYRELVNIHVSKCRMWIFFLLKKENTLEYSVELRGEHEESNQKPEMQSTVSIF